MAYRNGNYSAFYVDEPFNESNLGANSTKDWPKETKPRERGSQAAIPSSLLRRRRRLRRACLG